MKDFLIKLHKQKIINDLMGSIICIINADLNKLRMQLINIVEYD